ncbi:acetyl-CoA acetyltransferase [Lampropedia cohaerens]|uniref:Acetyl-CoA acetyltransferase n=1 Tax=Lampropedia cohaerens TaxID=1610491 RepID=A0A0U1PWC1_9BURK|nr:acetyl-CoA C-acyltransferase [Lampropedia cohaerens]KKW66800.1 acetyl-CoA acetyltransferase [Lampropedia cohaerens]
MSNASESIVIIGAARTPMGAFQGAFSPMQAWQLGAVAIKGALEKAGVAPERVDEVFFGNVLTAGQGQNPTRQATLAAGLPKGVSATTVGKVCGSAMKATMLGHDALKAGSADVIVAGGMESMTNAPYLLKKGRGGYRLGHDKLFDHMMLDGLEDAYTGGSMGTFGELCAEKYAFTRAQQDAFATASVTRAQQAIESGAFKDEIMPVTVSTRKGDVVVEQDEGPTRINVEKIPQLKPAFKKDGTITAAASSSINDGAAALVLVRESTARDLGATPLARIVSTAQHSQEPEWFTTAPVDAARNALKKAGWGVEDVDLWEVNEAFAVVTMALMKELNVPHEKVNVHGGACALGHPIGASGARIVVTLLNALKRRGLKKGLATLCIGGGEATAITVEML